VREQLHVAAGWPLGVRQPGTMPQGHVIECRITAEDPELDFAPSPGRISEWHLPTGAGIRLDTYCEVGAEVSVHYDSLLAKVIVHGQDRSHALRRMARVLAEIRIQGVDSTAAFLLNLMQNPVVTSGTHNTSLVEAR
jgi:acetyl-CoA carboxylase, biotin carboxylase subunit